MPINLRESLSEADLLERASGEVFGHSSEQYNSIDYEEVEDAYVKQQKILERRERYKESHRPKEEVEEHDNVSLPFSVQTRLVQNEESLKKIHKENLAIGYAVGMLNEVAEKLQKDSLLMADSINKLKNNPYSSALMEGEEELKGYEEKIDEDVLVNNILLKLAEKDKTKKKSKKESSFQRKELVLYIVLLFLVLTNTFLQNTVSLIVSSFSKEIPSEYIVKTKEVAICVDSTGIKKAYHLKEGTKLKILQQNGQKVFISGNNTCFLEE